MMMGSVFKKTPASSRRMPGTRKAALPNTGLPPRFPAPGGMRRNDGARFGSGSARGAFFLLMLVLLGACGFHPRGESARPAAAISPVFISGLAEHHPLVRELRRQMQDSGVRLTAEQSQAATILRLGKPHRKRSVFSVNANNKAVEYEVRRSLRFSVEHPPGNGVLNDEELDTSYIVYNPGGELLGRAREEELRIRDAYRELAGRLVTRLSKIR